MRDEPTVALPSLSIFPSELREFVIPGASLLVALAVQEGQFVAGTVPRPVHAALDLVRLHLAHAFPGENGAAASILVALVGVLSAYVLGHLLASVSSLLLDRILVAKSYGYPYSYLGRPLASGEPTDCPHTPAPTGPSYYSGFLFWLNIPILAALAACTFPALGLVRAIAQTTICLSGLVIASTIVAKLSRPSRLLKRAWRHVSTGAKGDASNAGRDAEATPSIGASGIFVVIPIIVATFAFGNTHSALHILAWQPCLLTGLSAFGLAMLLCVAIGVLRWREKFRGDFGAEIRRIILDKVFPFPYLIVASTLRHLLATDESFPPQMRTVWAKRLEGFGITLEKGGTEIFWAANLWLLNQGGALSRKINDWQVQYGFCRNLATSMWLAYLYGAWLIWASRTGPHPPRAVGLLTDQASTAMIFFAMATVMLYRYYYIFFKYFSKKLFEAFIWFGPTPGEPMKQFVDRRSAWPGRTSS